ncbi:MAG: 30S ribosomal protein S1 [Candidatus Desulfofervidaceae bacterium]|nr:30S ribosomal protein S1 [Candidatus Desulfofervidaceae bacterium]
MDKLAEKNSTVEQKDEDISQVSEEPNANALMDLYQESIKELQPGEIVQGKVVYIGKDHVMVDIGFKSEGAIPKNEFTDLNGKLTIKEGDEVEVLFQGVNEIDGGVSLSRTKAVRIRTWEKVERLYEKGGSIYGKIVARVKGGFSVDIGVPAFLPGSQVDIKPVRDYDSFVGKGFSFKIINYNRKLHNVILSRRQFLEEEKQRQKQQTLARLKEGAIVYGRVKNITDYGVFVDLGGIDGLLHITDISWGKVKHPADLFEIGDEIKVKVIKFDREKEKISLGIKQLTPDPWENISEKYPIGSRVKGRVTNLADYGAFVQIEEGVEGLIHISEMTWSKRLKHPSEVLSVGDIVEAVVLNADRKKRRLSLGLKQVGPDPWEIIMEKYPVGSVIEGKIKSLTDFGIFVEVIEGIDGLVHISDISWIKRIKHPKELYKKGEVIKAKVLAIDKEAGKIALGIKQLTPDPWQQIPEKFPVGSTVTGKITHITDFGLFVEVEEGIEGLIHISEVSREKVKNLADRFKIGDEVKAKVIRTNPEERKLGLSIKQLEEEEEKSTWHKYSSGHRGMLKLGDLIKTKMG